MLKQPWAYLVAVKKKTAETRTWTTRYRGPLAIGASIAFDHAGAGYLRARGIQFPRDHELPRGVIVATSQLSDIMPYTEALVPQGLCAYTPGEKRFAWLLDDVLMLEHPIKVRGQLGLFDVTL